MEIWIHSAAPGSPAQKAGLGPGDRILSINGRADLEDLFDWQFELCDTAYLELQVQRTGGTEETLIVEKDPDADLGLTFTSPVFSPIKTCNNACPFCFIDQQPPGLRASLYVKDDDWRLSYFNNTYITLTNLTPRDRQRMSAIRPGPLYVSVHATDPAIRARLLGDRPRGGDILAELRWLASLEIPFHAQIVVCPGINDGDALSQSLADLAALRPHALSVAVIPVGLTAHRAHLPTLTPVDAESARAVIARVEAFRSRPPQRRRKNDSLTDFVFLSDEFYYKVGLPIPAYGDYGDFPQLDDGVGTVRLLMDDFFALSPALPARLDPPCRALIPTGRLAVMALAPIVNRLNQIEGCYVDTLAVDSDFWGDRVDVAGLITGSDLIKTLRAHDLSGYDFAVIPSVMLKQDTRLFLDGLTVNDVCEQAGCRLEVVEDPYSAEELLARLGIILATSAPAT